VFSEIVLETVVSYLGRASSINSVKLRYTVTQLKVRHIQRRPRCVEKDYRAGTRGGEAWETLAATAGNAHGFRHVLSLSLFLFILVGLTGTSYEN
jgi:hypothetical protein